MRKRAYKPNKTN